MREERVEGITSEEIERAIKRLKRKKATGEDGIPNQAWIEGGEEGRDELKKVLNKIWNGEGFPEEWKSGIIVPIFKKEDKEEVKNDREVTMMDTGYRIYADIIDKKIRKEIKEKKY